MNHPETFLGKKGKLKIEADGKATFTAEDGTVLTGQVPLNLVPKKKRDSNGNVKIP